MHGKEQYILALDQGTTSSRAILFDREGKITATAQREFQQFFPQPGWVEHDPMEIWSSQAAVATEAIAKAKLSASQIAAIGITNQRETTILWDRRTGEPLYPAIVWQDRRTAALCNELKAQGHSEMIREKTGLLPDAYFSGTKIKWILDEVPGAREKAQRGEACFGTVDSWLIWNLTGGASHLTDITNASRTLLFNIHTQKWDNDLLALLGIPPSILPEVVPSSGPIAKTSGDIFSARIPISGIAGDQQAALFGQLCTEPGMAKTTYGTGCFLVMNTGAKPVASSNQLLTTVAWKIADEVSYALEGSVFIGGAAIQWLRDGLQLLSKASDSEGLASSLDSNEGVYFVPALTGLGAPYWDQDARGAFFGLTRGTTRAHMARAALESIAYQVHDVLRAMEKDSGASIRELRVDGGASSNPFLMQFQTDILGSTVLRPQVLETTALGAAYLAGLAVGFWRSKSELQSLWKEDRAFEPAMSREAAEQALKYWQKAVNRAMGWVE
ncbi:glycerol kinase GlpK [Phaeodactylibacter luteus]|uniref:Glycerol kinase n=1 Tax=Phaeodactylibacter luteus TaxID=1564516 RepID=A0A5C6RJN6_9BACT|nr:glycerol kinase GlpK [Phaeodactylibacter luteus]TXB62363.1 glycerol kinase GlpK [Phaeodactylibacter luteus]